MKYNLMMTTQFKKDVKLVNKQGKNLDKLFEIIDKLQNDVALEPKNKDHNLTGNYVGYRECHIEPDFLLIYKKVQETLILYLVRTGTHSELF